MSQILRNLIQQYAEEASFLWLLRNNAVRAPHYALKDLAKLDERVEALLTASGSRGMQADLQSGIEPARTGRRLRQLC